MGAFVRQIYLISLFVLIIIAREVNTFISNLSEYIYMHGDPGHATCVLVRTRPLQP